MEWLAGKGGRGELSTALVPEIDPVLSFGFFFFFFCYNHSLPWEPASLHDFVSLAPWCIYFHSGSGRGLCPSEWSLPTS